MREKRAKRGDFGAARGCYDELARLRAAYVEGGARADPRCDAIGFGNVLWLLSRDGVVYRPSPGTQQAALARIVSRLTQAHANGTPRGESYLARRGQIEWFENFGRQCARSQRHSLDQAHGAANDVPLVAALSGLFRDRRTRAVGAEFPVVTRPATHYGTSVGNGLFLVMDVHHGTPLGQFTGRIRRAVGPGVAVVARGLSRAEARRRKEYALRFPYLAHDYVVDPLADGPVRACALINEPSALPAGAPVRHQGRPVRLEGGSIRYPDDGRVEARLLGAGEKYVPVAELEGLQDVHAANAVWHRPFVGLEGFYRAEGAVEEHIQVFERDFGYDAATRTFRPDGCPISAVWRMSLAASKWLFDKVAPARSTPCAFQPYAARTPATGDVLRRYVGDGPDDDRRHTMDALEEFAVVVRYDSHSRKVEIRVFLNLQYDWLLPLRQLAGLVEGTEEYVAFPWVIACRPGSGDTVARAGSELLVRYDELGGDATSDRGQPAFLTALRPPWNQCAVSPELESAAAGPGDGSALSCATGDRTHSAS